MAGGSALTLTVNGSKFLASSVVRWNGASRPTTFVSATQLQASIGAGDIATAGTANVTVFTPAPGGGASTALPFTIRDLPALAVNATSVPGGSALTVTLTNGLGGNGDWLAFAAVGAANNSYLQYIYVGNGVTTRTWTVTAPSTPGTYEFRLFENYGYTRLATSPDGHRASGSSSHQLAVAGGRAGRRCGLHAHQSMAPGSHRPRSCAGTAPTVSRRSRAAAVCARRSRPADLAVIGTAQVTVFIRSTGLTSVARPFSDPDGTGVEP